MSKVMTQAIRGHNLRVTMAIAALAVLLLMLTLVAVLHTAPTTTGDRDANPASQSMSAEGKGGSSLDQDPIHRHVEVVERLNGGSLR